MAAALAAAPRCLARAHHATQSQPIGHRARPCGNLRQSSDTAADIHTNTAVTRGYPSGGPLAAHERGWLQVYVAWLEGGTAVFAFRGTESAQDAKADIDARSTPVEWMLNDYPSVKGHMGAAPSLCECLGPSVR